MIRRLPDWRGRLGAYVEQARRAPFGYGALDCALFTAGAVEAMTGVDLAEGLRGAYGSFAAGIRELRRRGYIDHLDMARAHFPEIPPCFAQVGDLCAVEVAEGPALGLTQGARIFLMSAGGLVTVDLLAARTAYRV